MKKLYPLTIAILFISACAPPGTGGGESSGMSFAAIMPFVLIFVLFYFLIIRPQTKQNKERNEMLKNVKRGDKVLTTGGMYGRVINVNEDEITLEIAKGINVQMVRSGISSVVTPEKENTKSKGGK
ncbi:MAG: preprotein translocase subunit YajC [Candidatus Dadabacteria bacterium]|nr:preprotein translocase subunit YajC [Candidatus Dadabacteria bacterium]NIQ17117.1 preprotein translocase subunit YajC [Candidatus Dadabacteria bacterium]